MQPAENDVETLKSLFREKRYREVELRATDALLRARDHGVIWKILGYAQLAQNKDAQQTLGRALQLLPGDAELCDNLGTAQRNAGQREQALASFRKAIELMPMRALSHYNLGAALQDAHQYDEALGAYAKALELNPNLAEACNQMGIVKVKLGRLEEGMHDFQRALQTRPDLLEAYSNLLFYSNYQSSLAPQALFEHAQRFGAMVARRAEPCTAWPNTREAGRKLKIGLVSGDLRDHPVSFFLDSTLAALAAQTPARLDIIVYATQPKEDAETQRIKAHCSSWRVVAHLSDAQFAEQVRADGIDVLLDLAGHTGWNRLPAFAWKPAPVQVSWLGYVGTTGLREMDYLLADRWTVPASEERYYTEAIWRLPDALACFTAPRFDIPVGPLPVRQHGNFTFGCFNNLNKLNDGVLALWSRLLAQLPGSRLLLNSRQLANDYTRRDLLQRFASHGIGAERLILECLASRELSLAAYNRVDIALDPFPYAGGTTTVEALWMGVPVLSMAGQRYAGHLGESYLHNAGLSDWIACDAQAYLALALRHASDVEALASLRAGLRDRVLASPVYDAKRYAASLEQALRAMWHRWCEAGQ